MKTCTVLVCFLLSAWSSAQSAPGAQSNPAAQQTDQQQTNDQQQQSDQQQNDQQQNPPAAVPSEQLPVDPIKEANIRRLLELTGMKALMAQSMGKMEDTMRPLVVNALPPGEYRERLVDLFFVRFHAKANLDHLLDLAIPIYDKHFSDEEIQGLIDFYQTPLGQKTLSVLPKVMTELADAGEQWGEQLGRECMREVLAEHPDLAKAMQAAGKTRQ